MFGFLKSLQGPNGKALCEGEFYNFLGMAGPYNCKSASSIGKNMQIEKGPSIVVKAAKIPL